VDRGRYRHEPATACLRWIIQEALPKEVFLVLGAIPGVLGTLQTMQAALERQPASHRAS
jgi:hypothetical protein